MNFVLYRINTTLQTGQTRSSFKGLTKRERIGGFMSISADEAARYAIGLASFKRLIREPYPTTGAQARAALRRNNLQLVRT